MIIIGGSNGLLSYINNNSKFTLIKELIMEIEAINLCNNEQIIVNRKNTN